MLSPRLKSQVTLALVAALSAGAAPAAGPAPSATTTQSTAAVLKLLIGQRLTLDGFSVVLNKVVQPSSLSDLNSSSKVSAGRVS